MGHVTPSPETFCNDGVAGGRTVTCVDPCAPPPSTRIVAVPTATPETRPVASTVATVVLFDDHASDTPLIGASFASRALAVSAMTSPCLTLAGLGVMRMEPARTLTVADPRCAPLRASMVAEPGKRPVTTPSGDTVAVFASLVLQLIAPVAPL